MKKIVILIGIIIMLMPLTNAIQTTDEAPIEVTYKPSSISDWIEYVFASPQIIKGTSIQPDYWMCEEHPPDSNDNTGTPCDPDNRQVHIHKYF